MTPDTIFGYKRPEKLPSDYCHCQKVWLGKNIIMATTQSPSVRHTHEKCEHIVS